MNHTETKTRGHLYGQSDSFEDKKAVPEVFYNANIFTPDGFRYGGFRTENGRFAEFFPGMDSAEGIDLNGAKVLPGLVDIHTHGNSGRDFSDGDAAGLTVMAQYLAAQGVTSFLPASMTLPYDRLREAFRTAAQLYENPVPGCARVAGIHMEGPFLSVGKKGAQNEAFLKKPDFEAFMRLYDDCGGLIRIVDIAPELPDAADFAAKAGVYCTVSAAHTEADYTEAAALFDAGGTHVTHLFNAMSPIHHRTPGVIGAASERPFVTAELICDGLHVHPSAVRMAFRLFPERICLISDALRCCGMPDGEYELGGQTVYLRDGAARLPDGTLAGSAVNLMDCLRNAIRFGIPEQAAICAATIQPAHVIRADDRIGSIEAGKYADFIVCSDTYELLAVHLGTSFLSTKLALCL